MEYEIEQVCVKSEIQLEIKVEDTNPQQAPETAFGIKEETDIEEPQTETSSSTTAEINGKVYENGKRNRLNCTQCDSTFKNRANLKRHLKFVHSADEDAVECSQCYRTFKTHRHLQCHINSVHKEESEVTCDKCNKAFLNRRRLNNHIFYAHPEPEDSVNCTVCKKTFKQQYNLKIHMRQVHSSENNSVLCTQCNKTFKNDMLLQKHVKWSHPADGMMYRCQDCGRMLPSIACYRKHMQNVHSGADVTCNICSKVFKTPKTLRRHIDHIHSGEKIEPKQYKTGDIQCSHCDKKFATNTALFWHFERFHSENKLSTTCDLCKKDLSDHASLKRHIEMCHSTQTAACHLCKKVFKSPMNLQRHIRVTHAPPEAAQNCDICNKSFKCAMHLRIHINTVHPKTGSFTCDICSKEFSSKKYMVKHRKTHVDSKEFPCHFCRKMFKSTNDVKKHIKRVHNIHLYDSNKCTICNTEFSSSQMLENHRLKEHTEVSNEVITPTNRNCMKCGKLFLYDDELHSHILACGTDTEILVKDSPSLQILQNHRLKEHIAMSNEISISTHRNCMKCGKLFLHDEELHSCDPETEVLVKVEPDTDSSSPQMLEDHKFEEHIEITNEITTPTNSNCMKCGDLFLDDYKLHSHMLICTKTEIQVKIELEDDT